MSQGEQRALVLGGGTMGVGIIAMFLGGGWKVDVVSRSASTRDGLPAAAARALPQVGYMRALSAEGVLSLKPTLVLATTAAGPTSTLDQLRATGIKVLVLPDHYDYDSVIAKITAVGRATGREAEAEAMVARGRAEMAELASRLAKAARASAGA